MKTEKFWGVALGILGLAECAGAGCGRSSNGGSGDGFDSPSAEGGATSEEPSPAPPPDAGHDAGHDAAAADAGEAPEAACTLAMWAAGSCVTPDAGAPEASVPEAGLPEAAPAPEPVEPCDDVVCVVNGWGCENAEVAGCVPFDDGAVTGDICPTLFDGSPTYPYQCATTSPGYAPNETIKVPSNVSCVPNSVADPSPFCATTPAK